MGCTHSTPIVHAHGPKPATKSVDSNAILTTVGNSSPNYPTSSTSLSSGTVKHHSGLSTAVYENNGNGETYYSSENSEPHHGSVTDGDPTRRRSASECSSESSKASSASSARRGLGNKGSNNNPKTLAHSTSAIGLDEILDDRREVGDLRQNIVHIEVPFGKPIEEVYDGVHSGPVLGSGISGLVRLVTHKATGIKYAVKVLDLGLVESSEGLSQLREEILILSQLDHPNIVRLEEVYESHSEIYLVQELCLGGELFDRLDEQPDYHYTEGECARLVKQMLAAVSYCHSRGIIHRDLKLENFLFSSTATDSELKMIDFGLSKHFRYGEIQNEAVGTPYTVAPEVIHGCYDERCDIWAIGVITFLLLSGEPPFGGCGGPESLMTVRSNILKGYFRFEPQEIWSNTSATAKEFIKALLVTDPKHRPTTRQAQKHKWLQEWATRARLDSNDHLLNPNVVKALVNFKEYSDMRKLLCEVLSFTLLPDQIKELRKEFEKMDTDGSGEISLCALKQVLMTNAGAGSLGALTEEEVEDIFNAMRVSKSETRIHWHEFIAAGLSQCQVDDRNLRLAFDRLDSDHKGYITLDDIMDLMGSDTLQSEEAMRIMWGDSIRAVKCQHARITYGDFLLLMKGQTRDHPPSQCLENEIETSLNLTALSSRMLHVVQENEDDSSPQRQSEILSFNGMQAPPMIPLADVSSLLQMRSSSPLPQVSHSAPSTPADHKRIIEVHDMSPSPLNLVEVDYDIVESGPGVPGTSAALTPPMTPERGARDYVTPRNADRYIMSFPMSSDSIFVPGLPAQPSQYAQRTSRSADELDKEKPSENLNDLNAMAGVVRDLLVPESGHQLASLDSVVQDQRRSSLQVNRHLYRAHRQMRLAVLEASKRFEESQTAHARGLLMAQQEAEGKSDGVAITQAGLVMRHGHSKQVSSEAIRNLLQENHRNQQALVEKYNKRGGRGRRSRKKTISDMSGMLSSQGQDEMTAIARLAASAVEPTSPVDLDSLDAPPLTILGPRCITQPEVKVTDVGELRGATVPGDFRKTKDPFGREGKYGAVYGIADEPTE